MAVKLVSSHETNWFYKGTNSMQNKKDPD